MKCDKDYDIDLINKLKSVASFVIAPSGILTFADKDSKQVARCNKLSSGDEVIDINKIINEMKGGSTSETTQQSTGS